MNHCLEECLQYRKLNLIRKCDECSVSFINERAFRNHQNHVHKERVTRIKVPKPEWLTCQILPEEFDGFNGKAVCKGCQKEFPAKTYKSGSTIYTLSYYIHCIKECSEYKDLQLIRECHGCGSIFLKSKQPQDAPKSQMWTQRLDVDMDMGLLDCDNN